MKKFLALVLCLTLVLTCFTALLGCGGNESGDTQSGNSVSDNTDSGSGEEPGEQEEAVFEYGVIYTLQQVYEAGVLSREDLLEIAYHNGDYSYYMQPNVDNNGVFPEDFQPRSTPVLSEAEKGIITAALVDIHKSSNVTEAKISYYCGVYYGMYCFRYSTAPDNFVDWEVRLEVGGISFYNGGSGVCFLKIK